MKKEKSADLGHEPVGKLLVRLAVPAITAQLVNMLYNIVDRIYIGHIPEVGKVALTGVGVTFPIIMIISAFSCLIGMGGAPRASIKMGQEDHKGAEEILGNCFVVLVGISVVLTAFFLIFQKQLLMWFGASAQTLPYATSYLDIYVCGTIFVQMALGLNSFISTQGFATTSMLTVIIGAIINIVLDPILIFGFNMGVQGAALATILSQAVSSIWVLWFLFGKKTLLRIKKEHMHVHRKIIMPVIALGMAPFIMQSTESLLNIAFNSSLQNYGGDLAVGAMTILSSLMQFVNMPLMGLTQGAQPIISFNFGARNFERVKKAFRLQLTTCLCYSTAFWLLMMVIPQVFVSLFNNDPTLLEFTVWASRIYMFGIFAMGAQLACQQTFIAVGQAKISMFLALLRKIILLIPLIYILPLILENKVFAVFVAEPIADILATLTTVTVFSLQFKKIIAKSLASPMPAPTAEE